MIPISLMHFMIMIMILHAINELYFDDSYRSRSGSQMRYQILFSLLDKFPSLGYSSFVTSFGVA